MFEQLCSNKYLHILKYLYINITLGSGYYTALSAHSWTLQAETNSAHSYETVGIWNSFNWEQLNSISYQINIQPARLQFLGHETKTLHSTIIFKSFRAINLSQVDS